MDVQAFRQATDHHRHCPGVPQADGWTEYSRRLTAQLRDVTDATWAWAQMDRAWTVMLFGQGLIAKETAVAGQAHGVHNGDKQARRRHYRVLGWDAGRTVE